MAVSRALAARRAVLAATVITICVAAPATASAVSAPAGLAFYSPPKRLLAGPHGSVIWARRVPSPLGAAAREYLVLYSSRNLAGKPVAVSGLVDLPKRRAPSRGWPVVAWAHGTTGIAGVCAPSRQPAAGTSTYVYPGFNAWLGRGYAIARTDYEGLGTPGAHPFLIGRSEGRGVLDVVRAARHLDSRVGRRFAIAGHSQGGHAALWAAALAPSWARELDFRGVVAFAPGSHVGPLLRVIPAAFTVLAVAGVSAVDPTIRLERMLSDQALALMPHARRECIFDLVRPDEFGALNPSQVLRPGANPSRLLTAFAAQNPALRIRAPVLILQGELDTTVSPRFTDQLVKELKAKGDAVTYRTYPGVEHLLIVGNGAPEANAFLAARLS
jgi:alpha-beta hydrolase superfamily lysophospholipase